MSGRSLSVRVPHERTLDVIQNCRECQPIRHSEQWVLCHRHMYEDDANRQAAAREGLPW